LGGLQAAVLRLPLVVGRNADAGLPADVLDRHAGVGLLEDRDDLGLGETGLLHGTSWLGKTCQKVLLMGCLRIGEAYEGSTQYGPKGWLFAILARMLEDQGRLEHKKVGSRSFCRSRAAA